MNALDHREREERLEQLHMCKYAVKGGNTRNYSS